ncbi:hypothetical protein [Planomonospora parontospora]|uniref:hypothetical protein n=1 Tax=Planomonospora parontospora TaxID=58119 RepID=UPI00166FF8F3|nr:hypothetical protein [Planomonospora parontospora]GGL33773.1 hypothetical protein GCM10014719_38760 [Planomonospora parontospora subsp. antibiotica]GII17131.1 hypothetical protein Ppa05_38570 [Planomonospora parontospora subsp. antibiotica]
MDVDDSEELEEDSSAIVICVRKRTRVRMSYRPCDDAEPGFTWYFIPWEQKVPAVGRKAEGGTFEDLGYMMTSPARRSGGVGSEAALSDDVRFEVCVKEKTRVRVSDSRCDDEDNGFAWYHIPYDDHVSAVGRRAVGGSFYRTGVESYRARAKGGTGDRAVLEPDRPNNAPTKRPPRCTRTVNGKCGDATSSCTYTVNGRCRDNGGLPGRVPGGL